MSEMRIRDMDPKKAPTKTAQDLLDTVKMFIRMNGRREHGFTKSEIQVNVRADWKRVECLLKKAVEGGHMRREPGRYFALSSFFELSVVELMGDAVVLPEYREDKDCWRVRCSYCGVSTTQLATKQEAIDKIISSGGHSTRLAHSLKRSAVNG